MRTPIRLSALVLALALGATACAVAAPEPQAAPAANLETLRVPEPEGVDWRRTIAGIEVVGSGTRPDAEELKLIERALGEIPDALLAVAAPRRIVRIERGRAEDGTAAYTLGPDVYLVDDSFRDLGSGLTTYDMLRVLSHELAHVGQFAALTDADVDYVASRSLDDPIPTSAFVAAFADVAGWVNRPQPGGAASWQLIDTAGAGSYAQTAPEEDMAESVSEMVTGAGPGVSESRVEWVEGWLQTDAADLAEGKPWVPPGSTRIVTDEPFYNEQEVARRSRGTVEVLSYELTPQQRDGAAVAAQIEERLAARGMSGSLLPVPDERVERYSGYFLRGDGVGFWVELWDFRNAPGYVDPPPRPVVSYVVLWR